MIVDELRNLSPEELLAFVNRLSTTRGGGAIGRCSSEIPKGKCTCCLFDTGLGNFIALAPGETEILAKGNTDNWRFTQKGGTNVLVCDRLRQAQAEGREHTCDWKPLDCYLYPFCPIEIARQDHGSSELTFIAGFPKCPLGIGLPDKSRYCWRDLESEYQASRHDHAALRHLRWAGIVSYVVMLNDEICEFYRRCGQEFKGYDRRFQLLMTEAEVETELRSYGLPVPI